MKIKCLECKNHCETAKCLISIDKRLKFYAQDLRTGGVYIRMVCKWFEKKEDNNAVDND